MTTATTIDGKTVKRVGETTLLSDDKDYAVIASYKDGDGDPFIKHQGSYDDCDDYAQRNASPDNIERYYVAEVIA